MQKSVQILKKCPSHGGHYSSCVLCMLVLSKIEGSYVVNECYRSLRGRRGNLLSIFTNNRHSHRRCPERSRRRAPRTLRNNIVILAQAGTIVNLVFYQVEPVSYPLITVLPIKSAEKADIQLFVCPLNCISMIQMSVIDDSNIIREIDIQKTIG